MVKPKIWVNKRITSPYIVTKKEKFKIKSKKKRLAFAVRVFFLIGWGLFLVDADF